jgi:hypothetical protein
VEATASKPPPAASNDVKGSSPEAQFHRLDKALLLKCLREVKAQKTINGMKPWLLLNPYLKEGVSKCRHPLV